MGDFDSSNNEWLELKNISNKDINLNGWQIIDKNQQIKIFFEDRIIKANSFLVLRRNIDYVGVLSNTNEILKLFNKDCVLIDEVIAQPNWPASDNKTKQTMERNKNLNWLTSKKVLGTPNSENSVYLDDDLRFKKETKNSLEEKKEQNKILQEDERIKNPELENKMDNNENLKEEVKTDQIKFSKKI